MYTVVCGNDEVEAEVKEFWSRYSLHTKGTIPLTPDPYPHGVIAYGME